MNCGISTQEEKQNIHNVKFITELAGPKRIPFHLKGCRKRGVGYPGASGFPGPDGVQRQTETEEAESGKLTVKDQVRSMGLRGKMLPKGLWPEMPTKQLESDSKGILGMNHLTREPVDAALLLLCLSAVVN